MSRLPDSTELPTSRHAVSASIPLMTPVFSVGFSLSVIVSGVLWNSGFLQPSTGSMESRFSQVESALQGALGFDARPDTQVEQEFRPSETRARPVASIDPRADSASITATRQLSKEQHTLAEFLAKRYRVALESTQEFVDLSYRVARDMKLDPWLILAIMGIESSFDPNATSNKGAQGLMQVLTRVHADKFTPFGGVAAAFDPLANIKVGAKILKDYIDRDGSIEAALKSYVGAAFMASDSGYGDKVLLERERLAAVAQGRAMNPAPQKAAVSAEALKSAAVPNIIELGSPASSKPVTGAAREAASESDKALFGNLSAGVPIHLSPAAGAGTLMMPVSNQTGQSQTAGEAAQRGHKTFEAAHESTAGPAVRVEVLLRAEPAARAESASRVESAARVEPASRLEPAGRVEPVLRAEPAIRTEPASRSETSGSIESNHTTQ